MDIIFKPKETRYKCPKCGAKYLVYIGDGGVGYLLCKQCGKKFNYREFIKKRMQSPPFLFIFRYHFHRGSYSNFLHTRCVITLTTLRSLHYACL